MIRRYQQLLILYRISTHYPERADETFELHGPQRGIDIKDSSMKLPASKKTILFFRLADMYANLIRIIV
jgi:hypothetical protein